MKSFFVDSDHIDQRLDNFLFSYFKIPKRLIYRCIRKGQIRVNSKKIDHKYRLKKEDNITSPIFYNTNNSDYINVCKDFREFLESSIIFENENYLIINKPPGLPVHGGSRINSNLIDCFRLMRPKQDFGLVHRLDKSTSGCMLLTKKYRVLKKFNELFKNNKIQKVYHAVVHGKPKTKKITIESSLIRKKDKIEVARKNDQSKKSLTNCRIVKTFNKTTLLEVFPITGRMHQIRVHLSSVFHPIVHDIKYGNHGKDSSLRLFSTRMLLHAFSLKFLDPIENKLRMFKAPYDFNFQKNLENLCL